jgi:hypothetical protein
LKHSVSFMDCLEKWVGRVALAATMTTVWWPCIQMQMWFLLFKTGTKIDIIWHGP